MNKEIKEKKKLPKLNDWLKKYIFFSNYTPSHLPKIYEHPLKNLVDKPVRPFRSAKDQKLRRYKISHWIFRKPIFIGVFISSFVIGLAIVIKILMVDHIEIATNAIKIWFK